MEAIPALTAAFISPGFLNDLIRPKGLVVLVRLANEFNAAPPGAVVRPPISLERLVLTSPKACCAWVGLTGAGVLLLLQDNTNNPKVRIGINNLCVFIIGFYWVLMRLCT
jgi:hypothetical protein